jgi:hypothetical protein
VSVATGEVSEAKGKYWRYDKSGRASSHVLAPISKYEFQILLS